MKTGKPGRDDVSIKAIELGADGKNIKLTLDDVRPVHQLHIRLMLKGRNGAAFEEEIYWTINRVPR